MPSDFKINLQHAPPNQKQLQDLYDKIVRTEKIPQELNGSGTETKLLGLSLIGYILNQNKGKQPIANFSGRYGDAYVGLFDKQDLEGQKALVILSSKFADAAMESRLLEPNGEFDREMASYLSTRPAVTVAFISNLTRSPDEFRRLYEPFGARQENGGTYRITGFTTPSQLYEQHKNTIDKVFIRLSALAVPLLPDIIEHDQKMSEAISSPTSENILAAAESNQQYAGNLALAGVFAVFSLAAPFNLFKPGLLKSARTAQKTLELANLAKTEAVPQKFSQAAHDLFNLAKMKDSHQIRLLIVGCSRKMDGGSSALLKAREEITLVDVEKFLAMDAAERNQISKSIFETLPMPSKYKVAYRRLENLARMGFPNVDKGIRQELLDAVQHSRIGTWRALRSKLEFRPNISVDETRGLIQLGRSPKNSLGPKVHIALPSLSEKEHYALADNIFSELSRISDEVGPGMSFKFLRGTWNYRVSNDQFGKDFTLYFTDINTYERVLPHLKNIGNQLYHYAPEREISVLNALRKGIAPQNLKFNVAHELPVASYISQSIRAHHGNNLFSNKQKIIRLAQELQFGNTEKLLRTFPSRDGYLFISDPFLRNNSTKELNLLLDEAYRRGLLNVVPK